MAVDEGERRQAGGAPERPEDSRLDRFDELAAIYRMADAVSRAEDPEAVFEAALDAIQDGVGVPRAAVVLFGPEGEIHFRAWRGISDEYRRVVEGRSPWKKHVGHTESLIVEDVFADAEVADLHDAFRREQIGSMALVPLVHASATLGRFVLYAEAPGAIGAGDVRLAEAIASQVAASTVRRRAEDELRHSRNELEAIFRRVADGITVQDASGRVVYANDAAARLSGFESADALLAAPFGEIVDRFELLDDRREPLPPEALPGRVALQHGEETERVLCYRVRATGVERWSVVRATPVRGADGSVVQAINVFHDVTERRRAEERLRFLGEASRLLAGSLTIEETLAQIGRLAVPGIADYCLVDLLEPDGSLNQVLRLHADPERDAALAEIRERYPPLENPAHPVAHVLATGEPVVVTDEPGAALDEIALEGSHRELYRRLAPTSFLAAPLVAHGRRLGAISLGTSVPRPPLDADTVELALGLADRAAIAVANARLYREAQDEVAVRQRSEERVRFLAEASRVLGSSLDYETTLRAVARLAVPRFADWCIVYMPAEDGTIRRIAVEHAGGDAEAVRAVLDRHPLAADAAHGVPLVLRTGEPQLTVEETSEHLASDVGDPEALADELVSIVPTSSINVPLIARGRTLGAIALLTAESGRRYSEDDVAFVSELAGRAAVAVDNALLYGRATETLARLDAFFAAAPVGLAFFDAEGRFVQINESLAAANGVPVDAHQGRRPTQVNPALGAVEELVDRVLESGRAILDVELGGDGPAARRWVANYYPVLGEDGTVTGAGSVVADVTEQHRTAETLRFLSETSETLAGSLDERQALQQLVALTVPSFAEGCAIFRPDGDVLVRVAEGHADPELAGLLAGLDSRYQVRPDSTIPAVRAFVSGEPELHRTLPPRTDREVSRTPEELEVSARLAARSAVVVPLAARGRTLGSLAFWSSEPARFGEDDLAVAKEIARRAAVAVDRAELYREASETAALLQAVIEQMPGGVVVAEASTGRVVLRNEKVDEIWRGDAALSDGADVAYRGFHPDGTPLERHEWPLRRALEAGATVRGETIDFERFDGTRGTMEQNAAPVRDPAGEVVAGVVTFDDVTARVRAAEQVRFLAEASAILASSLDVETTLDSLARLAVPHIADWCSIALCEEDGAIRNVAVAHRDPAKAAWAQQLQERFPTEPDSRYGVPEVLRTGEPQLIPEIPDELLVAATGDRPELLAILRELGLRSSLIVPLVARNRAIGALSLVTSHESGRVLDEGDLALAQEVARRAAVAVDNARLYAQAEFERTLLESQGEASVDGLLVVSPEGRMLSFNRRFGEIWDLPEDVLARQDDGAALAVALTRVRDSEGFIRRVRELYERRETSREELELRDGRTLERFGAPVTGPDGAYRGYLWSFRDITEQRRAAERLEFLSRASELLAESLDVQETLTRVASLAFPALADFCVFDITAADGNIRQVAAAHRSRDRPGFRAEMARYVSPLDHPAHPVSRAIRTRKPQLQTTVDDDWLAAVSVDEEHREFLRGLGITSFLAVPLLLGRKPIGAVTFAFSDSGRRHGPDDVSLASELARRAAMAVENARLYEETEARAQSAQALEFVGDGVFLVDAGGVVRLWNPAAERITGLRGAELVGRPAADVLAGWPLGQVGERQRTYPVDAGSRELWLSLTAVPFADGTVYAFRDLTEEHAVERLKTDFVSTVSHELRTPLAAIYGAAMTLQRTDVSLADDQRVGLLAVVASEAERLARIVNDVLWASRLDAGVLEVSIESCDAAALAEAVVAAARTHLPPGIDLAYVADEGVPQMAADPDKVRQVLVNLVDNAVKYSPDGGRVELHLAGDDRTVRFSVSDHGLGIPAGEHERIFEKFYRLDPNLTRGVGGTGLGLYICRELVRRMDGRVSVESAAGMGSTFTVELPAAS